MKVLNKKISQYEYLAKRDLSAYRNTVETQFVLNDLLEIKKEYEKVFDELFSLWENLGEAGEIKLGKKFNEKYEQLKNQR